MLLQESLEDTESYGRLCRSATLRDIDETKALVLEEGDELAEVVFSDVVTSEDDLGGSVLCLIGFEGGRKCLDDGTSTEVATADTYTHYIVAALL